MATTSRFALHYQALTDTPDGAGLGQALATDVDGWLARDYPVANATARTSLTGVPEGFRVRQQDDGSGWVYTNSATWQQIYAAGGSGSVAGLLGIGFWSASSVQSFATATETPVAFGNEDQALSGVTRNAKGAGHSFTVTAGSYIARASVRWASGTAGSRFLGLRENADVIQYASDQGDGGPNASTRQFAVPLVLPSTTTIYVVGSQSSGGSLNTQPTSGSQNPSGYVQFSLMRLG